MTTPLLIDLAVGEPGSDPSVVSLADAAAIASAAQRAGVTALRLRDRPGLIDPSVVAGFLAGRYPDVGYLVDLPTSHNAPYNAARRVLSLDRAAGGRIGVVLRAGEGDEVSEAVAPDLLATDPAERWAEYARIVSRLWESFPAAALLGDQEAALVVDTDLIRPIHHEGRFYRVAGPLDGPSSSQGRPVLAAQLGELGWSAVAESADVVIIGRGGVAGALQRRAEATVAVDRSPVDVVLVGAVEVGDGFDLAEVLAWAANSGIDALELVPTGGAATVLDLIAALGTGRPLAATLRAALGLPQVAEALA